MACNEYLIWHEDFNRKSRQDLAIGPLEWGMGCVCVCVCVTQSQQPVGFLTSSLVHQADCMQDAN